MPIPAIRTKQTTNTTGTGTLTLNAASAEFRSFNAAFGGSSQRVRYALSRAGVYEVGYGTFNGGSPGTLTRVDVIASSNGGALVSLAAGTTDVFVDFLPGDRAVRSFSTNTTLAVADLGNLIRGTQTADITVTLPPIASVPDGMGFLIKNDGSNWSILRIDPNAAELLEGLADPFPLFQGEAVEIFAVGASWRMGARPMGERMVAHAAAAVSASVDFVLPHYVSAARSSYRAVFRNIRPATDGAELWLRTDDAGGASFDAGASDYSRALVWNNGAASVTAAAGAAGFSAMNLSGDADFTSTNPLSGQALVIPGATTTRFPSVIGQSFCTGNGGGFGYAGPQVLSFGGYRAAAQDINAIRFLMSTGNIQLGEFTLFATFN